MGDNGRDKVFGRYNELVLLILGFALTTLLGGYLTSSYQERSRLDAERTVQLNSELTRAISTSDEVSHMLDRRLYRTRVLIWAIKDQKSAREMQLDREEYRKALSEWNENLNRIYTAVEYSFGVDSRSNLESNLTEQFRSVHQAIDACVVNIHSCDIRKIEDDTKRLNPQIYSFDSELLALISQGRVGAFREGSDRKISPAAAAPANGASASQPVPISATAVDRNGWWIRIERLKQESPTIAFDIGQNNHTFESWKTWNSTEPLEFDVPNNLRNINPLYIKARSSAGRNSSFCLMYKTAAVKKFYFDDEEDHEEQQSARDGECNISH